MAAGHTVTLVTDAQVATPGFLDGFDVFIFTRPGGAFNATLRLARRRRCARSHAARCCSTATSPTPSETTRRSATSTSPASSGPPARRRLHRRTQGATAGLTANGDGQPALNLIAGTAGASQFTGNSSTINATRPVSDIPCCKTSPCRTPSRTSSSPPSSAAPRAEGVARYARTTTPRSSRRHRHTGPCSATTRPTRSSMRRRGSCDLVTDAQVATPGFLDASTRSSSPGRAARSTPR